MGLGGPPNPGIWGEAVRGALNASQDAAAQGHEASAQRAALDEAELRELEGVELYGGKAEAPLPARRRSLLDRLLRR
jgi:hypothetical protein